MAPRQAQWQAKKNDLGDFNVPKTEETKNLGLLIDFPYT
jgi:hypothetical protein